MNFKWIGEKIAPPALQRLQNRSYYEACQWNGKTYSTSDYVLISNADATDSEHLSDCYVGQIRHLYHAGSRKTDPFRAIVQWYSRIKQLPKLNQKVLQNVDPPFVVEWELVHEGEANNADICIETIFGKCQILHCPVSEIPYAKIGLQKKEGVIFFARFLLKKNPYNIVPLAEAEKSTSSETPSSKRARKTPFKYLDDELPSPLKNCDFTIIRTRELSVTVQKLKIPKPEDQTSAPSARKRLCLEEPSTPTMSSSRSEPMTRSSGKKRGTRSGQTTPAKEEESDETVTPRGRRQRRKLEDSYTNSRETFSPIPEEGSIDSAAVQITEEAEPKNTPRRRGRPPRSPKPAMTPNQHVTPLKRSNNNTPMKTPESAKRWNLSVDRTPTSSRKRKLEMTPGLPQRTSSVSAPSTPLSEARRRLHVSSVPVSLPCREQQFADIYTFVEDRLVTESGGCMYISGVPGTGKTATVQEVIRTLRERQTDGDLPDFNIVEVNGMKMTVPQQVYSFVWQAVSGQKVTAEHALTLLDQKFSRPAPRRPATVLIVDELDLLWTKKQDVLYNLFDWPTRSQAKLIVLAISNTMDLPERLLMNRVASRLGLTRLTFQPYTVKQLQSIVTSRLEELDCFDAEAVEFVARKVSAVSGDARRALDICRRAAEIAERNSMDGSPRKRGQKPIVAKITIASVDAAIQEMFSSPKYLAMQACSLQEQFFLQALVAEYSRTGIEENVFNKVIEHHFMFCDLEGVVRPNISELLQVCANLSASRLIIAQHGRYDLLQKIRLNVSSDDVTYAMKQLKSKTS